MNALKRTGLAIKAGTYAAWSAVKATFSPSDNPFDVFGAEYRRRMWSWGAWSYSKLANLTTRNPHARRGMQLLIQNVASVPLVVQQRQGSEWEAMEEPSERLQLFEQPNPRTTRQRFWEKMLYAIYCGGEFFLEKQGPATGPNAGEARQLRVILPDDFVQFQRSRETGEVEGYLFRNRYSGQTYSRDLDQILHVRAFNPTTPARGLPILVAGMAMQQMKHAQEWNTNIAKGGGRVPGYWTPNAKWLDSNNGKPLSPEQIQEAQEDFDERSLERAQANLDMFLTGAFERTQGDVSPKDADWIKGQKLAIRQIATLLGIPPTLLGDEKAGSLTDSGVDSEVRALMLLTVLPLLEWLLTELSGFLLPDGRRFYYDRDQIESLQEDVNAVWKRYTDAFVLGVINRDEARRALGYEAEGLEEEEDDSAGGDGALRSVPELDLGGLLEPVGMEDYTAALQERFGKQRAN